MKAKEGAYYVYYGNIIKIIRITDKYFLIKMCDSVYPWKYDRACTRITKKLTLSYLLRRKFKNLDKESKTFIREALLWTLQL